MGTSTSKLTEKEIEEMEKARLKLMGMPVPADKNEEIEQAQRAKKGLQEIMKQRDQGSPTPPLASQIVGLFDEEEKKQKQQKQQDLEEFHRIKKFDEKLGKYRDRRPEDSVTPELDMSLAKELNKSFRDEYGNTIPIRRDLSVTPVPTSTAPVPNLFGYLDSAPQSPVVKQEGSLPISPLLDVDLAEMKNQEQAALDQLSFYSDKKKKKKPSAALDTSISPIRPSHKMSKSIKSGMQDHNISFPASTVTDTSFRTVSTIPPPALDRSHTETLPPISSMIGVSASTIPQSAVFAPPGMLNAPLSVPRRSGRFERLDRIGPMTGPQNLTAEQQSKKSRASISSSMQQRINQFVSAKPQSDMNVEKAQIESLARQAAISAMSKRTDKGTSASFTGPPGLTAPPPGLTSLGGGKGGPPSDYGSMVGNFGDGDGGGGGPPSSPPSSSVSSIRPIKIKQPPNVLSLPSLRRQQFQAPSGVDITVASSPISPEEEEQYKDRINREVMAQREHYENEVQLLGAAFDNMAVTHPIPDQDTVWQILKPDDLHDFATNDAFYNHILAAATNIIINEEAPVPADALNPIGPDPAMRMRQLAEFIYGFNAKHRMADLRTLFSRGGEHVEMRANFAPHEIESLLLREKIYNNSADVIAEEMLQDPMFNLTPNQTKRLEQVATNAEVDKVLREHGHLTDDEFEARNLFNQAVIVEIAQELDPTNALGIQDNPFMKNRKKAILKSQVDFNVLMERMDRIGRLIRSAPQLPISQNLSVRLNNIITKMKEPNYDIREAYGALNGIYNILKPVIDNPQEYAQSNLSVGDVIPEVIESKQGIEPAPPLVPGPEGPRVPASGVDFYSQRMAEMRTTYGVFAFPNIQVRVRPRNPFGIPIGWGTTLITPDQQETATQALEQIGQVPIIKNTMGDFKFQDLGALTPDNLTHTFDRDELEHIFKSMVNAVRSPAHQNIFTFNTRYNAGPAYLLNNPSKDPKVYAQAIWDISGQFHEGMKMLKGEPPYAKTLPAVDLKRAKDLRRVVKSLRLAKKPINVRTHPEPPNKGVAYLEPIIPPSRINPPKKPTLIDIEVNPAERARRKSLREKKFTQQNFKFAKKISKETPEINRAEYGKNIIEYDIQSDADLMRMKTEVTKMKGDRKSVV